MPTQSQTTPDPDFNPAIPSGPVPAHDPEPVMPEPAKPADDEDLPIPPIFPTA